MRNVRRLVVLWVGFVGLSSSNLLAQERWVYRYNGPDSLSDGAHAVVAGSDSNLYVAGYSQVMVMDYDFTVVSLTPSGGERWVYNYDGPGHGDDRAECIAMGADSNLYAAGYSWGSGTSSDFMVVSLTSWGGERWVYRYNGPADSSDAARSIVAGPDNNLYVAGGSQGNATSADFLVVSLTSLAMERWVYRYHGPDSLSDFANSIVFGMDGNLYAAGMSCGVGTEADFIVISLDTAGTERWVYRYNGPGDDYDCAWSIVMASDGNLYAAGQSYGAATLNDFVVISLTPDLGVRRWMYRYNGPSNGHDEAYSIVVGTDGNLYVAGESWGGGFSDDFMVVSLDTAGTERWVYRYNGPGNGGDGANSIIADAEGNLHVAGRSYGSGTETDFTVISLTSSAAERWVYRYNPPANLGDKANSIAMGVDGNLYAAGCSHGGITQVDLTVISLNPDLGVEESLTNDQLPMTNDQSLHTYPNPFTRSTVIQYSLPPRHGDEGTRRHGGKSHIGDHTSHIRLTVYDLSGRPIRTLVDQPSNHLTIQPSNQVVWDGKEERGDEVPTGTYFCRLTQSEFTATTKLILLR